MNGRTSQPADESFYAPFIKLLFKSIYNNEKLMQQIANVSDENGLTPEIKTINKKFVEILDTLD